MLQWKRTLACLLAALWLLPAMALAAPVYHLRSETSAPFEEGAAFVDASPLAGGAELLQVDILGIRQGDAIVVYSGGQSMLIDGGQQDRFKDMVQYLDDHQMDGFDVVFLTHAHNDHLQVQEQLVKAGYRVGKVLSPYDASNYPTRWQDYRRLLEARDIPYEKLSTGEVVPFGNASFTLYQWVEPGRSLNDESAASMLQFGEARIFLAADISGRTQHWFLEQYGADSFRCDIYKSAHHGIGTVVPEFMEAMSPSACVVTNTKARTSLHDKQLDRLNIARYYVTMGTIHLQTDGKQWFVWQGPRL